MIKTKFISLEAAMSVSKVLKFFTLGFGQFERELSDVITPTSTLLPVSSGGDSWRHLLVEDVITTMHRRNSRGYGRYAYPAFTFQREGMEERAGEVAFPLLF
jgi:hypothetical protein